MALSTLQQFQVLEMICFPILKGFSETNYTPCGFWGELHTQPMRSRTWIRSHAFLLLPFTSFSRPEAQDGQTGSYRLRFPVAISSV